MATVIGERAKLLAALLVVLVVLSLLGAWVFYDSPKDEEEPPPTTATAPVELPQWYTGELTLFESFDCCNNFFLTVTTDEGEIIFVEGAKVPCENPERVAVYIIHAFDVGDRVSVRPGRDGRICGSEIVHAPEEELR